MTDAETHLIESHGFTEAVGDEKYLERLHDQDHMRYLKDHTHPFGNLPWVGVIR